MPGTVASMPYLAVPLILGGTSSCGNRLADQRVLARRLELDRLQLVGRPHLVCLAVGNNLGVAHLLAGLGVDDLAIGGTAFAGWHAHHHGTRFDQRDAPGRTGPAHRVEVHAHAPRAAGDQRTQHGIVVLGVVVRQHEAHHAPVGLEFFGHDLRHGGGDVLAHLGLADHHRDLAVRRDRIPGGRPELARCCQRFAETRGRDIAEGQARGAGADQEIPPIEVRR